jgi:hypothetical protein
LIDTQVRAAKATVDREAGVRDITPPQEKQHEPTETGMRDDPLVRHEQVLTLCTADPQPTDLETKADEPKPVADAVPVEGSTLNGHKVNGNDEAGFDRAEVVDATTAQQETDPSSSSTVDDTRALLETSKVEPEVKVEEKEAVEPDDEHMVEGEEDTVIY